LKGEARIKESASNGAERSGKYQLKQKKKTAKRILRGQPRKTWIERKSEKGGVGKTVAI